MSTGKFTVHSKPGEQLKLSGKIVLKEDCQMRNTANDGKYGWDKTWKEPSWKVVPVGTEVEYQLQETRVGFYHTVTFRCKEGIFNWTKKTDTFAGRKPL